MVSYNLKVTVNWGSLTWQCCKTA